jgi:hypothetical protein
MRRIISLAILSYPLQFEITFDLQECSKGNSLKKTVHKKIKRQEVGKCKEGPFGQNLCTSN